MKWKIKVFQEEREEEEGERKEGYRARNKARSGRPKTKNRRRKGK